MDRDKLLSEISRLLDDLYLYDSNEAIHCMMVALVKLQMVFNKEV